MTEVLGDFIRALRAADVRVSTSESIDAGNVLDLVGFNDRMMLRDGLSQVLAKSEYEKEAFRDTFDRFFAFDQFNVKAPGETSDDDQSNGESDSDEADQDGPPQQGQPGGMPGQGGGGDREAQPGGEGEGMPRDLVEMLESGDQAALQMALADAWCSRVCRSTCRRAALWRCSAPMAPAKPPR